MSGLSLIFELFKKVYVKASSVQGAVTGYNVKYNAYTPQILFRRFRKWNGSN